MNETAIKKRLSELAQVIATVPSSSSRTKASEGIYYPETSKEKRSTDETFDHLRLQIKYLMFDLEATRRENKYLRQMLNNRRPRSDDSKDGFGDF